MAKIEEWRESRMTETVISRRQLVRAAHTAITYSPDVTPELRRELLEVANTTTRISASKWWSETYDTGCLIGLYRRGQGLVSTPPGTGTQRTIGGLFTMAMRAMVAPYGLVESYECYEPPLDLDTDFPEPLADPRSGFVPICHVVVTAKVEPEETEQEQEQEESKEERELVPA